MCTVHMYMWCALRVQEEVAAIVHDVAPAFMQPPLSLEATAERYIRPALRQTFIDLCTLPVSHYIDRFEFKSDLLKAMYAVTDGFSGLNGGWDTPGTGMNFLAHNMVSVWVCPWVCVCVTRRVCVHTQQGVCAHPAANIYWA